MALPVELKVMIIRNLFLLPTDIHVLQDTTRETVRWSSAPPFKYNFYVIRPGIEPTFLIPLVPEPSNEYPGSIQSPFALAGVNKELRELALQVFYGDNKFVLGPFFNIGRGQPDVGMYHLGHWKNAIGGQASSFLRENYTVASWETPMAYRPGR